MWPEGKHNFYHPLKNTSIRVTIEETTITKDQNGLLIDEIDLYYQPVQNPTIGITFFLIKLPILILGILLNIKVLSLIKRETSVVNDVTKVATYAQMIFWPIFLCFTTATDFVHPLNEILGEWVCDFGWFITYFFTSVFSLHSFIVALMRYCFIVHNDKFEKGLRKERTKQFFLFLSVLIPLLMVIWGAISRSELDILSYINKCNGKHHKVFLVETSTIDVLRRNFCEFDGYDSANFPFGQIIDAIKRVSCIARTTVLVLMVLNFTEIIIYYKIFSHINR